MAGDGARGGCDVLVVGGGPAGLTAALFTARHGRDTVLVDARDPILARCAHVENYPGFVGGVDPRLLLDLMRSQCDRAGVDRRRGRVERVGRVGSAGRDREDAGFAVATADGDAFRADRVVAATKHTADYLAPLDGVGLRERGEVVFVDCDDRGRTAADGLYAAGRLAGRPDQAVVAAGHGAAVATALLEDDDAPFYHDWTAPAGYFTDRGHDVPPGCEEIDDEERRRREDRSRRFLEEAVATPHPRAQRTHSDLRTR